MRIVKRRQLNAGLDPCDGDGRQPARLDEVAPAMDHAMRGTAESARFDAAPLERGQDRIDCRSVVMELGRLLLAGDVQIAGTADLARHPREQAPEALVEEGELDRRGACIEDEDTAGRSTLRHRWAPSLLVPHVGCFDTRHLDRFLHGITAERLAQLLIDHSLYERCLAVLHLVLDRVFEGARVVPPS